MSNYQGRHILCLKVKLKFRTTSYALAGLLILGIACTAPSPLVKDEPAFNGIKPSGPLLVPGQEPSSAAIHSLQLSRKGDNSSPPFISLHKQDQLILEFDDISDVSRSFEVRFTHHTSNWEVSSLPENRFIDGINSFAIVSGRRNSLSTPRYYSYQYTFPNREVKFLVSGNYMIHVYDRTTNQKVLNLPFFISEEQGQIHHEVEQVYHECSASRSVDQVFTNYEYPDEIAFPQFNLTNMIVQNRFWGSFKKADQTYSSLNGSIEFHTSRSNSFDSEFDFLSLDLSTLRPNGRKILDWDPGKNPPQVVLKEDVVNFTSRPRKIASSESGEPVSNRTARYVQAQFQLYTNVDVDSSWFFLAGDFNQWVPSPQTRLSYNEKTGLWQANVLIKQGKYQYKYFRSEPKQGSEKILLPVNGAFSWINQEYTSFIYYRDPDLNYDRLLKISIFHSAN